MSVTFTASVIKADVGSPAGHTKPSDGMLEVADSRLKTAVKNGLLVDATWSYTGDDTALTMIHRHGVSSRRIHKFAWETFKAMTTVAQQEGDYAAGQDLLKDAPSGNIKGAGPGVAELDLTFGTSERPVEAFMVFTGDKCAPGIFNSPLRLLFSSPDHNTGLLLVPELFEGFTVTVIDMGYTRSDKIITLTLPEDHLQLAALLRNPDRFAIESVWSRAYSNQQIVSASTTRLHNVAGRYTGKDDPTKIIRVQKIFPAPEEVLHPWFVVDWLVTGNCRGSHKVYICPSAINMPVAGPFCFPVICAVGYSLSTDGQLSERIDFMGDQMWDANRLRIQEKNREFRLMGCDGAALAAQEELAYTGLMKIDEMLKPDFRIRPKRSPKATVAVGASRKKQVIKR